ncbi:hypothetical protein SISSUDRAFT_1067703 [Sistotremastrum suecicum HHB10207 ss-3]|uniref:Uncharacterized protein n=1 Tax=Sistotremastrum suecicum HHB10207 ss-3 TaxID=1314776 RepID=A0A165WTG2_9AGAM|nr:hypothetical protein SISSUDRAFT_1067703 [Sistotremastrum suecicum HHB10207 ss-3]
MSNVDPIPPPDSTDPATLPSVMLGGAFIVRTEQRPTGTILKWGLQNLFGTGDALNRNGKGDFTSTDTFVSDFPSGTYKLHIHGTRAELDLFPHDPTKSPGRYKGDGIQKGLDDHYEGRYGPASEPHNVGASVSA